MTSPFLPPLSKKSSISSSRGSSSSGQRESALNPMLAHSPNTQSNSSSNNSPSANQSTTIISSNGRTPRQHRTPPLEQPVRVPMPKGVPMKHKQAVHKPEASLHHPQYHHPINQSSNQSIIQAVSHDLHSSQKAHEAKLAQNAAAIQSQVFEAPDTSWEQSIINNSGIFGTSSLMRQTVESLTRQQNLSQHQPPLKGEEIKEQLARSAYVPPVIPSHSHNANVANDVAMIAQLTRQVAVLEARCNKQQDQLMSQATQMQVLQTDLAIAEREIERGKAMEQQLADMTQFLNDYGLQWVGSDDPVQEVEPNSNKLLPSAKQSINQSVNQPKAHPPASSRVPPARQSPSIEAIQGHEIDIIGFLAACHRLNENAGNAAKMQVVNDHGVTKFQPPQALPLVAYRDGLVVGSSGFRSWSVPAVKMFVCDVNDGFFPSELKSSHPNGTAFDIIDRSDDKYENRRTRSARQSRADLQLAQAEAIQQRFETCRIIDSNLDEAVRRQMSSLDRTRLHALNICALHVRSSQSDNAQSFILLVSQDKSLLVITQAIHAQLQADQRNNQSNNQIIKLRWATLSPRPVLVITHSSNSVSSSVSSNHVSPMSSAFTCPADVNFQSTLRELQWHRNVSVYLHCV